MNSRPLLYGLSVILAVCLLATSARSEQSDAKDQGPAAAVVSAYTDLFNAAREAGQWPDAAARGVMVEKALGDTDVASLSVNEVGTILSSMPVLYNSECAQVFDARLAELAQGGSPEAAWAASLRFQLLDRDTTQETRFKMMQDLFEQPGLIGAWKQGNAYDAFGSFGRLNSEQINTLLPKFVALGMTDTAQMPVLYFSRMAGAFYTFAGAGADDSAAAREPLRVNLVDAINSKLEDADLSEQDSTMLTSARDRLDGAYARGQLLDHKAPELNIIWWSNPADADESIAKLDDLKGKVVVLDFWATWCGPCVGSFPNVKELQSHYDGYDVAIVGVTSLQGAHYPGDERGKIDTTDDPAKEMTLMKEFMEAKGITWRIAFAEQPVFNPDYGVNGIPHVAIIDTQGVVRFRGLHPAMPMEQKTSKIDQLLAEAGKPVPPATEAKPAEAEMQPGGE